MSITARVDALIAAADARGYFTPEEVPPFFRSLIDDLRRANPTLSEEECRRIARDTCPPELLEYLP